MIIYFKILLLAVARSHKDKEQRRVYDKKYYCAFCGKAQARIARHLESKHTKQDEIKDILTLDIKTVDPASYRPCPHCFGFLTKMEMWRHAKHCEFKDQNQRNQDCSMQSEGIKSVMQHDDIPDIVRENGLIAALGSALIESQGLRKGNLIS